jgi:hypothetical protein
MTTYGVTATVDKLLKEVIKILNGHMEGSDPSIEQMEDARFAFNRYLDNLPQLGSRFFLRANRQYIFPSDSIVLEGGVRYRCIKAFTAPTITTHATSTSYSKGDNVYPSVYNGFRYEAQNAGDSAGSAPTFPVIQNYTVIDNDITWKAIPDEKPNVGLNWRTYFKEDSEVTGGSAYAAGNYVRSGEFNLQADEVNIENAFIRKNNEDTNLDIVTDYNFQPVVEKAEQGKPTHIYVENVGVTKKAHLYPNPDSVGIDGYVLHYKAQLRAETYEGSTVLNLPPDTFTQIIYGVADMLAMQYNLSSEQQILIKRKLDEHESGTKSLEFAPVSPAVNVVNYVY